MSATTPELNNFVRDYLAALAARDAAFVLDNSVEDDEAGYSGIHTGGEPIDWNIASTAEAISSLSPAQLDGSSPKGWMIGDVAWFTDFPHGVLPNGQVLDDHVRLTIVVRRVAERWKVAHWHISEQVPRDLDPNAPVAS
jgi:hypothetical protein